MAPPGLIKNKLEGRLAELSLDHVKLVCFDEADEIFNSPEAIGAIFPNGFNKMAKKP